MKNETDTTGWATVDSMLKEGGLKRGEITIFHAGRGTGKSVYHHDVKDEVEPIGEPNAPDD